MKTLENSRNRERCNLLISAGKRSIQKLHQFLHLFATALIRQARRLIKLTKWTEQYRRPYPLFRSFDLRWQLHNSWRRRHFAKNEKTKNDLISDQYRNLRLKRQNSWFARGTHSKIFQYGRSFHLLTSWNHASRRKKLGSTTKNLRHQILCHTRRAKDSRFRREGPRSKS